jgi:C4-dicarboxylate transporter
MSNKSLLLAATVFGAAVSVLLSQAAGQAVVWTKTVDEALERAKTEKKVVLLAINLEGERSSDEFVDSHYQDAIIGKLSANILCVFCSAYTGKSASDTKGLHNEGNKDRIVAPQHVLVGPDGKIISSASHYVSKGELEWMIVDAIH